MDWFQIKHGLTLWTGLNMDALHVHIGVFAQLLTALILRRSLASPLPWLALLIALIANEWFDLAYETWPNRDEQLLESVRDGWNTMLLPTALLLLSRYAPTLLVAAPPPAELPLEETVPDAA